MMQTRSLIKGGMDSFADFGWKLFSVQLTPPAKRKTLVSVPYRSGSYDFSTLYGSQPYEDRTMTLVFVKRIPLGCDTDMISEFVHWLYAPTSWYTPEGRSEVADSYSPDWYYKAECISAVPQCMGVRTWQITATFLADPFRCQDRDGQSFVVDTNTGRGSVIIPVGGYWDRTATIHFYGGVGSIWLTEEDPEVVPPWDYWEPDYKDVTGATVTMTQKQLYIAIQCKNPYGEATVLVTDRSI